MNNPSRTAPRPGPFEPFLAASISGAQAAALSCAAIYRLTAGVSASVPTPPELREMDEACDRWIGKRARAVAVHRRLAVLRCVTANKNPRTFLSGANRTSFLVDRYGNPTNPRKKLSSQP